MWCGVARTGLPSSSAYAAFISGSALTAWTTRVADQVGEGDLPALAALQVVVDDDPVVDEQLGRERADAGGGGHGEAGHHVLRGAGGGAAELGELGVRGRRGSARLGLRRRRGAWRGGGCAGWPGRLGALGAGAGRRRGDQGVAELPAVRAGCGPVPFPRGSAGSRRRTTTRPGRPNRDRRGSAGTARRQATRWRRSRRPARAPAVRLTGRDEGCAEGALRSAAASGDSEDTADIAFFRKIRCDY